MLSRLLGVVVQPFRQSVQSFPLNFTNKCLVQPDSFLVSAVRTKVRCYFPRPNEVRRVRRHGWEQRMSTQNGRRVIMRRILKGRFVLTH